jgi:hypothetical protein
MRIAAVMVVLTSTGCVHTPESYPIPAQHSPVSGPERLAYGDFVHAADPGAESYILADIRGLENDFRWTGPNPELRFFLKHIERLNFRVEFGVHPVTLKDVGPLEFTIEVNGHFLAEVRENTPGAKSFQRPVPAQWLNSNADNRVKMRVRNPWPTADKNYLGFVLHAAGFVE